VCGSYHVRMFCGVSHYYQPNLGRGASKCAVITSFHVLSNLSSIYHSSFRRFAVHYTISIALLTKS
jgi:hypothetical protein